MDKLMNYYIKSDGNEVVAHGIELALPGYKKSDIKIEIVKDKLVIKSSGSNRYNVSKDIEYHEINVDTKGFEISYKLPEFLDTKKIHAKFEDGLLIIEVGIKELPKARNISID